MKKPVIISLVAIVVVLGIGGILLMSMNKPDSGSSHSGMPHDMGATSSFNKQADGAVVATDKVVIKNFSFSPSKITIKKGTTVTWTNQDDAHHDITPDQSSPDFKNGPLLAKGESYSYTFMKAGTFTYHCSPHPYMKASVEVTE